jgi:hypothetical protein
MSLKIGAIVRSVGERTEKLCLESLKMALPEKDVVLIKDVSPFLSTLKACYKAAIKRDFDWYLLVDADMVMTRGWYSLVTYLLQTKSDINKYWEFTFRLKDSVEPKNIDAIHVVNGKYSEELLRSTGNVKNGLKPEGSVRDDMIKRTGVKRLITKDVIAYHGFEQYLSDVYFRFYNRACRDPRYVEKRGLFKKLNTDDKKIGKKGWDYGVANRNLRFLDSRDKTQSCHDLVEGLGFKERRHITYKLPTFYKKVGG